MGFGSFKRKISFYLEGVSINLGYKNSVAHLTILSGRRPPLVRKTLHGEKLTGRLPGPARRTRPNRDPNTLARSAEYSSCSVYMRVTVTKFCRNVGCARGKGSANSKN